MLPLYYSSILEEHKAVRQAAGLFDVSHLGHLEVSGESALQGLQSLVTQDVNSVDVGRACYTPMLNPQGIILDEMIFYRLEPDRFRFVVNASNGDKVLAWIREHLSSGVVVEDLREAVGTLALQGPRALSLLEQVAILGGGPNRPAGGGPNRATLRSRAARSRTASRYNAWPRYGVRPGSVAGRKVLIARTGYTGEDGVELFVGAQDLEAVWKAVLEGGRVFGIKPIGLGARDTLRLEAGLPLGGSDLDETTTPLEAGLEWTIAWNKGPFIGREALERQKAQGLKRKLVGFELSGPGVPRAHYPILKEAAVIGQVTSGTVVPGTYGTESAPGTLVGRGIGMGYVPPKFSQPGTALAISIHGRDVPAQVVSLPFYRRKGSHG